jgi:uncharacterized Zn finger protein
MDQFRGFCDTCKEFVNYITLKDLKRSATIKCPKCGKVERVGK